MSRNQISYYIMLTPIKTRKNKPPIFNVNKTRVRLKCNFILFFIQYTIDMYLIASLP